MTDTPKHVQKIQLALWLAKSPGERLVQFLTDNDALYKGILAAKINIQNQPQTEPTNITHPDIHG